LKFIPNPSSVILQGMWISTTVVGLLLPPKVTTALLWLVVMFPGMVWVRLRISDGSPPRNAGQDSSIGPILVSTGPQVVGRFAWGLYSPGGGYGCYMLSSPKIQYFGTVGASEPGF